MLTCSTLCHGAKSSSIAPSMYVTKSEPRSQSLKEVFTTIVCSLKEGNNSLKVVPEAADKYCRGARLLSTGNLPPSPSIAHVQGFT